MFDFRPFVIFLPLIVAAGWALVNIIRLASQQFLKM